MRKIIAATFVAMLLIGSASAESGYTWQDEQNMQLDGNMVSTDC